MPMRKAVEARLSERLVGKEKEVYGVINGHTVLLRWDTRGPKYNERWQVEAVKAFKRQAPKRLRA